MPGGDGTGPMGMGSMTGRGAGWCAGFGMPGYANSLPGRGFGLGFGRGRGFFGGRGGGRGWRNMYYATGMPGWMRFGGYDAPYAGYQPQYTEPDPEIEKQALRNQAKGLQSELDFIKKRLDEIENNIKAN
jgi:hypothetical protein